MRDGGELMSDAMLADFSRKADAMTYDEVISLISLLLDALRGRYDPC